MRRILLVLIILFSFTSVKYRTKEIPYPIPEELEDVYALDTLLSGYWTIRIGEKEIYPAEVGYRVQPDMEHYTDWPSMESVMERSYTYFRFRYDTAKRTDTGVVYYEDRYVRVFVKER